jgi:hypothetical protein
MKTVIYLVAIFSFFYISQAKSQTNLVPNNAFEIFTICPQFIGPPPKLNIPPWVDMTPNRASYFNICANNTAYYIFGVPSNFLGGTQSKMNYQKARSGNGYTAFVSLNTPITKGYGSKRSYQSVNLTDTLQKGRKYLCKFFVALSDGANYATNNIAMVISKTAFDVDTSINKTWIINTIPQIFNYSNPVIKDTQNWVEVSSIYTAKGGEQFIAIGNFKDSANTTIERFLPAMPLDYDWAVYALDDVFVTPLDNNYCLQAYAGRDTAIHIGDSVFIGSLTNGIDSLRWLQNGLIPIDSSRPGFWLHPTVTTSYILQQTVNGCFSADTVFINVQPLPLKFISYTLRQAQADKVENSWVTANEINVSHFNIQRSLNGRNFIKFGKVVANNKSYNEYSFTDNGQPSPVGGNLYYRIESVDFDGRKQYSETRTLNFKPQTLNSVSIYPNPTKDNFSIKFPATTRGINTVKILDTYGKTIMLQSVISGTQNININNTLASGIYTVQITNNITGKTETQKLIVNK